MTVVAIASDAPLMIGAVSAALCGQVGSGCSVVAVGPVLGAAGVHRDDVTWAADVVVVDAARQRSFADIEASALPSIAARVSVVLLLTTPLGHRLADLLRLGVRGLLPHTCSADDLLDAVHHVTRGDLYVAPEFGIRLAEQFMPDRLAVALTPREREVLDLLAQSYTYAEIAAGLRMSRHTVKFHVSNVLAKFGVRTRRDAVARWVDGPFGPTVLPTSGGEIPPATSDPPAASGSYGEADRSDPARFQTWGTT